MNYKEIARAARQIQHVISGARIGVTNAPAKEAIQALVASIRTHATDYYTREKAGNIEGWIEVLFSTTKWKHYGGAAAVRHYIAVDCASIERRAQGLAK